MKKQIKELGLKILGALIVVLVLGLASCNKEDIKPEEALTEAESNATYISISEGYYKASTNNHIYTLTKDNGVITLASIGEVIIFEYRNGMYLDTAFNNRLTIYSDTELRLSVSGTTVKFIKQN